MFFIWRRAQDKKTAKRQRIKKNEEIHEDCFYFFSGTYIFTKKVKEFCEVQYIITINTVEHVVLVTSWVVEFVFVIY